MYPYVTVFGLSLPAYGLWMAAGVFLASSMAFILAKKKGLPLDNLVALIACAVGTGILGAKTLYVLVTYSPAEIWKRLLSGDFSFFDKSGAVFLGGLVAGIAGALLVARILKVSAKDYLGSVVPFIPLAHAFGRMGCYFAGCCYGIPYEGFCGILYPVPVTDGYRMISVFPVQFLEAAVNLLIFGVLLTYSLRWNPRGYRILATYALLYSLQRFFIEFLRGDLIRGIYLSLSTSQWLSMAIFFFSLTYLITGKRAGRGGDPDAAGRPDP